MKEGGGEEEVMMNKRRKDGVARDYMGQNERHEGGLMIFVD